MGGKGDLDRQLKISFLVGGTVKLCLAVFGCKSQHHGDGVARFALAGFVDGDDAVF